MIQESVSLKPYNTFGIDVNAKRFAQFSSIAELRDVLAELKGDQLLVIGGGSNLLLTKDFDGLVVRNQIKGIEVIKETDEHVWVRAGAGEVWHDFVVKCIQMGYGGVENLSLIPGNVGASPMQNIGAYGVEIKDVFDSLEAYHLKTGKLETFDADACDFGYRESVFKRSLKGEYIICSVTYRLDKNPTINTSYGAIKQELQALKVSNPTIKDVSQAVINIRSRKLPNPEVIGNAGSFFKNPVVDKDLFEEIKSDFEEVPNYPAPDNKVKLAAGWLIEKAGWKGKHIGNYGVHKNQALVLVNYGGASGSEIYDLSESIINDVEAKFGIRLEREVNII